MAIFNSYVKLPEGTSLFAIWKKIRLEISKMGWLRVITPQWINSDSETIFRRFRNQISAIPQPKSDTLPQPRKGASATKKNRFRNQKKTIPQPKKGDSATKTRGFRNQKKAIPQPPSARLRNQHPRHNCGHSQHSIVSRCGGVGWGGIRTSWQLRSFLWQTCGHTQDGIVSRCGGVGVGWDNNVLAAAFLPLTHLRPHSTWHRLQMRGGGWDNNDNNVLAAAFLPLTHLWRLQMRWGGVGWDNNVLAAAFLPLSHLQPHSTWHRLQMRGGGVG